MHKFTKALAAIGLAAIMSQSAIAESMKLGFLGQTAGRTVVPD